MTLTIREKRKFLRDLIRSCEQGMLAKLQQVPEEWDGIELRQWIADYFAAQTASRSMGAGLTPPDRKRARDYKNEVLVRNLV